MRIKMRLTDLAEHGPGQRARFVLVKGPEAPTLGIDSHVLLFDDADQAFGKLVKGEYYYVDFSPAPAPEPEEPPKE